MSKAKMQRLLAQLSELSARETEQLSVIAGLSRDVSVIQDRISQLNRDIDRDIKILEDWDRAVGQD